MLRWIWTWILPIIVLWMLYQQVIGRDWTWDFTGLKIVPLIMALALLPFNLFLESYKWYVVTRSFSSYSIVEVIQLVLAGRSLNVLAPAGIGDAIVRVGDVKGLERKKALSALFVCRTTQLVPTMFFGAIATSFLSFKGVTFFNARVMPIMIAIVLVIIAVGILIKTTTPQIDRLKSHLEYISRKVIFRLLVVSFLRYAVFSFQFLLIFYALNVSMPVYLLLLGIFWVFMAKSLVPGMLLVGDLMTREVSTLMFFSLFVEDVRWVMMAGLVIWLINIVIPAILGLFFVSKAKRNWL
ncbi:flippase-like domain-containing protein [Reichenbachiella ulvae]|uniref:Flippase-like domain-containing protein n=1 Tax=Reichenbachiella ulvae TaxID=2980104 RepID=A0ABT3CSZ8_9BACT|nr:flippase-like domain-containing protein [Reichenbachiella ulvae]MCV9386802.1 flippase-like domain-containing protein [Reichenbachiella ulvae]